MSLHLVIDGYNLIRQSPALRSIESNSLEEGRDALIARLAGYKRFKTHSITVVFDGAQAHSLGPEKTREKGIDIIFSRHGELADNVIKRIVAKEGGRAVVVTSDRDVANHAVRYGAATIDSVDFEFKMRMAGDADSMSPDLNDEQSGWRPTTKKKGPARRRSKKQRRSRARTRKL
jgi:predicted RNA-binding protein with PIN domain